MPSALSGFAEGLGQGAAGFSDALMRLAQFEAARDRADRDRQLREARFRTGVLRDPSLSFEQPTREMPAGPMSVDPTATGPFTAGIKRAVEKAEGSPDFTPAPSGSLPGLGRESGGAPATPALGEETEGLAEQLRGARPAREPVPGAESVTTPYGNVFVDPRAADRGRTFTYRGAELPLTDEGLTIAREIREQLEGGDRSRGPKLRGYTGLPDPLEDPEGYRKAVEAIEGPIMNQRLRRNPPEGPDRTFNVRGREYEDLDEAAKAERRFRELSGSGREEGENRSLVSARGKVAAQRMIDTALGDTENPAPEDELGAVKRSIKWLEGREDLTSVQESALEQLYNRQASLQEQLRGFRVPGR